MTDTPTAQDQRVHITRVFPAPPDVVFRAWTEPDHVAAWFGPEHFDTPRDRVEIDLRVGGRYELTMVQRGSGAQFPVRYEIVALEPPRLLVLRSDPIPEAGIHEATETRVELDEHPEGTRMTLTDGPYVQSAHAEAGWNGAFAKLAARLSGRSGVRSGRPPR